MRIQAVNMVVVVVHLPWLSGKQSRRCSTRGVEKVKAYEKAQAEASVSSHLHYRVVEQRVHSVYKDLVFELGSYC